MSYQENRFRNPKKREAIFSEDAWKCAYCLIDLRNLEPKHRTVDHIITRSRGGTNDITNLITACHPCNSRRGDTLIQKFVGQETLVRLIREYPRVARTIVESMTGVA